MQLSTSNVTSCLMMSLADLVSELPQPPEVIEAYGSDVTDMILHRQLAVEPDPEITHNVSTVNGCPLKLAETAGRTGSLQG